MKTTLNTKITSKNYKHEENLTYKEDITYKETLTYKEYQNINLDAIYAYV